MNLGGGERVATADSMLMRGESWKNEERFLVKNLNLFKLRNL